MTVDTPPSPQHRRSRLTYQPPARESHQQPLPPPVSDMQALFAMLTVQQTQMTELIGQNKQMRDEHQTMQVHLTPLELQPSGAPSIHGARSLASNHGAFTRSKQRAVRQLRLGLQSLESIDSEDKLLLPPSVAASTNSDDENPTVNLGKADKMAIQKTVTTVFRRACSVKGKEWPDPEAPRINPLTGQESRNLTIICQVVKQADTEPKAHRPAVISNTAVWDERILMRCAKESFRGFKKDWKKAQDAEAATRAEINDHSNCWYRRCCTVCPPRCADMTAYMRAHPEVDAGELEAMLHEQHVSDEASGPEDESEERKEVWKLRMVTVHQIRDLSLFS
ncbi:hypothetical protein B0H10DRAFT_2006612 [Mycena sp. CBHHK59/15]|nr:hypothetical protein B0H10DRAFT_2006612 [Mycena sp. CBHHK59/15]